MTSETRNSDDIERDSRKEREQMSHTIDDLQKKFSVETIVGDLGNMLRTQGSDIGHAVTQTVGRNPAAVAMIGAGLAWLVLGQGRKDSANGAQVLRASSNRGTGSSGYGAWEGDVSQPGLLRGNRPDERDRHWYENSLSFKNRRSSGPGAIASSGNGGVQGATSGLMASVQGAASAVGDAASGAADSLSDAASDLTSRLSHGLDDLSEDARARVVTARRAAHDARIASEEALHGGAKMAGALFRDQPLVVGALAIAAGAALGGLLPHSRLEDEALGESSDELFANAQALFREERDKAMSTLKDAATDVKDEVSQAGAKLVAPSPKGKPGREANGAHTGHAPDSESGRATGDVAGRGTKNASS